MTRCRNNLIGCVTELKSLQRSWNEANVQIEESWNDETAKSFREENFHSIEELFSRMVSMLQEAAELVRKIEKRTMDPNSQV
jgi:hypothetical protein